MGGRWIGRGIAATTGTFAGVAVGLPLGSGDHGPFVTFVLTGTALLVTARALSPAASLMRVVAFAFALRAAAAAVIYTASTWMGRGGFITGDDLGYAELSWGLAQYLRGTPEPPFVPPHWGGAAYQLGPFTYLEAVVFYLFGPRVLLMEVLNAGLATASIVFVYLIARTLLGKRAALAASWMNAVYPSLVLWSALNLREGLALLVTSATLWTLLELRRSHTRERVLAAVALLLLAREVRGFTFAGLAAAAVAAFPLVPLRRAAHRRRAIAAVLAIAVVAVAGAAIAPDRLVLPQLRALEAVREAMANEARTAFYRPPVAIASEGDTFVVYMRPTSGGLVVPLRGPFDAQTTIPPADQQILSTLWVRPPVRLVLGAPDDALPTGSGAVPVQVGDMVIIGERGRPPLETPNRRPLYLNDFRGERPSVQLEPSSYRPEEGRLQRTLAHVPIGVAYALFAPWPFALRQTTELLTVPEMLLWYGAIVAAAWTLWSRRGRWSLFLPLLAFLVVVFAIFVFAEGNTGILFRHRAMIVPYVLVFAAPGVLAAGGALKARARAAARAKDPASTS